MTRRKASKKQVMARAAAIAVAAVMAVSAILMAILK